MEMLPELDADVAARLATLTAIAVELRNDLLVALLALVEGAALAGSAPLVQAALAAVHTVDGLPLPVVRLLDAGHA